MATAFAAPIGGLLFTIEEGASFYSTSIFWRGFLSTGIGVFTLHFLVEASVSLLNWSMRQLCQFVGGDGVVAVMLLSCRTGWMALQDSYIEWRSYAICSQTA